MGNWLNEKTSIQDIIAVELEQSSLQIIADAYFYRSLMSNARPLSDSCSDGVFHPRPGHMTLPRVLDSLPTIPLHPFLQDDCIVQHDYRQSSHMNTRNISITTERSLCC